MPASPSLPIRALLLAAAASLAACIEVAPPDIWSSVGAGGTDEGGPGGDGGRGGAATGGTSSGPLPPCSPTVPEPCARVVEVDAGRMNSCARFDDGAIRCWGANDVGQLGVASVPSSPVELPTVATLPSFDAVTLGHAHGCGLDGTDVYCWGDNEVGQLGVAGPSTAEAQRVDIPPAHDVKSQAFTTCARTSDGVWCWGLDQNGQDTWPPGHSGTFSPPHRLEGLEGVTVLDVPVSYQHACVLLDGEEARCWGRGQAYRLGTGNEDDRLLPTPVLKTYPDPVHHLVLGHEYGCVIAGSTPAAYCWGYFGPFHYYAAGPVLYDGWVDKPYVDVQPRSPGLRNQPPPYFA